jgi:hypothetical protein
MVPWEPEQPPSSEIRVGTRSSATGTVSMLSRQKEPGSSATGCKYASAIAVFDPAIRKTQLNSRHKTCFIATARLCVKPCASAPGRIRKTLYAREYDRFFALQHKFHGFPNAAN